jgi:hypothetical protein
MKSLGLLLCICLVFSFSGCGNSVEKHEAVVKDSVDAMNEFVSALESVKDSDTAKQAAARIDKVILRFEEIGKTAQALPHVTKSQRDSLDKKMADGIKSLDERMAKLGPEIGIKSGAAAPELMKAIDRFHSAMFAIGTSLTK